MGNVLVLATGGTIASLPQPSGDVQASLSGEQLVARLGDAGGPVRVETLFTVGSFAFTLETLHYIARAELRAVSDADVDGVVVTQGTDTLEETAFFLAMVTERRKPVVLTGAQLDASHPQSDGPQNLADAVAVARIAETAAWGPVVVFAGAVHGTREVRKVDTTALDAFASPGWGPLGRVDRGKLMQGRLVRPRPTLPVAVPRKVALIRLGIGMTGDEVSHAARGASGVVLQAFGRGNAHPSVAACVADLVSGGIPVIVTSRCPKGSVAPIYGGGGGCDLERSGAWFGGDLSGEKARLLLGLLLAHGIRGEEALRWIDEWGRP